MKVTLFLASLGLCVLTSTATFEDDFSKGFTILTREGRETEELKNALKQIKVPNLFEKTYKKKEIVAKGPTVCKACNIAADIIIAAGKDGYDSLIVNALGTLCSALKIQTEEVCSGVLDIYRDTLLYVLTDSNSKATSERMCAMLFQVFNCPDDTSSSWEIDIPELPEESAPPSVVKSSIKAEPIKIVQITDIHYDPNYEVGSNAECEEPLCCQAGSKPATPKGAAGYWGDYRKCDMPWHSVIDTLDQIVIQHPDISYVYFTGDIVNHKVWKTDIISNENAIIRVTKQLKNSFGKLPVFPILGNHEPHPVNLFSYDKPNSLELSTKWIFELSAEQWSEWLPEETKETILKGGYYTVKVRDGLRIIALNSNVCYTLNFWLIYDDVDPFDQLKWLVSTLEQAEKDGEKVHLLSHVPTGESSCLHNWSNEFVKIVNRFSATIAAQFNGHTHNDDVVLFFGNNNEEVTNIAFNGGSLTSYTDLNPNYKVFHVEPNAYSVLDFEAWTYNLTEANWDPRSSPQWYNLYNFTKEYQLEELTLDSVSKLVEKMALNPKSNLLQDYFRNKNRDSDTALALGCDAECEVENLCYIVTYEHGNDANCEKFTKMYNNVRPSV